MVTVHTCWLAALTARLHTIRDLLREFGIAIPVGAHHVMPHVRVLIAAAVPVALLGILADACDEIGTRRFLLDGGVQIRCRAAIVSTPQTSAGSP